MCVRTPGSQTLTLVVATATMIQEQIARIWSMGEDPISMSNAVNDDDIDDITDEAVLVERSPTRRRLSSSSIGS